MPVKEKSYAEAKRHHREHRQDAPTPRGHDRDPERRHVRPAVGTVERTVQRAPERCSLRSRQGTHPSAYFSGGGAGPWLLCFVLTACHRRQILDRSGPVSPVRIRVTLSTAVTQILPSPIFPVRAALAMASTTSSAISAAVSTSILTLGTYSTLYSAPR